MKRGHKKRKKSVIAKAHLEYAFHAEFHTCFPLRFPTNVIYLSTQFLVFHIHPPCSLSRTQFAIRARSAVGTKRENPSNIRPVILTFFSAISKAVNFLFPLYFPHWSDWENCNPFEAKTANVETLSFKPSSHLILIQTPQIYFHISICSTSN